MKNNNKSLKNIVGPIRLPLEIDNQVDYHTLYYYEYNEERWASVIYGDITKNESITLRIESACFFGHVLNSRQCDCGFQLNEAFARIRREGNGIVIYGIDQDARGLGIEKHYRIYDLRQNHNLDTKDVFKTLNADLDNRSYDAVREILKYLKVTNIKLLSNNPRRIQFLEENGFKVEREELESKIDNFNMATLMLEKEDLGYKWSFQTHAHWLTPIQNLVKDNLNCYAGRAVKDNTEIVAEWSGDEWNVAENIKSQLKTGDGRLLVIYLSDYPRIDEISIYAKLYPWRFIFRC